MESVTSSRDAALSRTVQKIFSSLWQSVGRERLLRVASNSCRVSIPVLVDIALT